MFVQLRMSPALADWHALDMLDMVLQANYLGSAVVNNVNVLDLLLGSKENQINGVVPQQGRRLHQIIPGRTGVYQTGSSTIQVRLFLNHTLPHSQCQHL